MNLNELTAYVGLVAFVLSGLPFALRGLVELGVTGNKVLIKAYTSVHTTTLGFVLVVLGSVSLAAHTLLLGPASVLTANYVVNAVLWSVALAGRLVFELRVTKLMAKVTEEFTKPKRKPRGKLQTRKNK